MKNCFKIKINQSYSLEVNKKSRKELIDAIRECLKSGLGFAVATVNLDHLVKLRTSETFRTAYAAQTFIVADGNPIVWLSKLAAKPVELVPGSELIEPICKIAAQEGIPVAFLGTTQEALELAKNNLCYQNPNLQIVEMLSPPKDFDPDSAEADEYIEKIKRSGAKICFLALGAPKQEVLASRAVKNSGGCGFISIGAGLDFLAGSQIRAPSWVRKIAMEWFWRMATNPARLAKRYFLCLKLLPFMAVQALGSRFASD